MYISINFQGVNITFQELFICLNFKAADCFRAFHYLYKT